MQGMQFSEYMTNDDVLQIAVQSGILNMKEIAADVDEMKRKELLSLHTHEIWQNSKGMYLTYVYDENGNRKIRRRKTKEEIEQLLVEHYRSLEEEIHLKDVFEQWVDMKLRFGEIQRQSYDRYKTDFERFFPASENICRKKFRNINEKDLEEFIKRTIHDKKLTRKSYNGLAILINGIFKYGKHEGLTQLSITQFMGDLELPRNLFEVRERRKEQETFSEEEIPVIRKYLTENPDMWNLGLMLLFQTGMRVGEVTTLKREDIGDHSVHVRRTEFKYKDTAGKSHVGVKEQPKTDAGNREIILPTQAMETLRRILEKNPDGEYLLMNNGIRIRGTTLTKRISDICRKLKLEHHSAHKIRKTYGTTLLDSSVNDIFVAEQMGHKSVETTRQLYYFSNKSRQNKMNQIEQAVSF